MGMNTSVNGELLIRVFCTVSECKLSLNRLNYEIKEYSLLLLHMSSGSSKKYRFHSFILIDEREFLTYFFNN
jgi:hypothetical protein